MTVLLEVSPPSLPPSLHPSIHPSFQHIYVTSFSLPPSLPPPPQARERALSDSSLRSRLLKEEVERLRTHTAGLEAQLALVLEKREGEEGYRKESDRLKQEV
jgi:hypothetical protein